MGVSAIALAPKTVKDEAAALLAEVERLRAENDALKAAKASGGKLAVRVSEKGAVSVYGLGRFPVTLYQEQWTRLLAHGAEIEGFIKANAGALKVKGQAA